MTDTLTIDDVRTMLRELSTAAAHVNLSRAKSGLPLKQLRICPECRQITEHDTCDHKKEMH